MVVAPPPPQQCDPLVDALLAKLRIIPHHAISLRRNKYRVIRWVARQLGWDIVRDKDDRGASFLWLDKWETADMTSLRIGKVRRPQVQGARRMGASQRVCRPRHAGGPFPRHA